MIAGGIALVSLVYLLVTEKLDFYLQGKKWLTRICLVIGVGFILTLPEMLFGAHDGEQTPEIVTPDSAKEWGPLFGDSNQM
jgi:sugar phosphate permease